MGREYSSLAKQVLGSIRVFCLTETGKEQIYGENYQLFILNVIGKTPSLPNV